MSTQVTKNFSLEEMACKNANEVYLTPDTIRHAQRLQKFRDWYNRPIIVNSWYRTPEYNKKVGGAEKSQHVQGLATDCALPDEFFQFTKSRKEEFLSNVKAKWQELVRLDNLGGGVGFYDSFFHLDSRPGQVLAFWDSRKN
jgi:uncharacterized protein YcbK (DUF882 family)